MPPWWKFVDWSHASKRFTQACWIVVVLVALVIFTLWAIAHTSPDHCTAIAHGGIIATRECVRRVGGH